MYDLVSARASSAITREDFVARYRAITSGATIISLSAASEPAETGPASESSPTMTAAVQLAVQTARVGEFVDEITIPLILENGQWRVDWTPDLIFKDLGEENLVRLVASDPMRGSVRDRNGQPLAAQGALIEVGAVPGQIEDEAAMLAAVTQYFAMTPESVRARLAGAQPDWWVPLTRIALSQRGDAEAKLGGISGLGFREVAGRVYPYGELAAQTIGYVSRATADDLQRRAGYEEGDWIGRAGVEGWFNDALAGQKGGRLVIVSPSGETIRVLAEREMVPGQDVHLSIDVRAQQLAEEALGDKAGSIVVLGVRDNNVLALASNPRFDPNGFIVGFSVAEWQQLNQDVRFPFLNRPVQSAYPTGSIFKIITMAAGMEKAGYAAGSRFQCNGSYTLAPGVVLRDWVPQGHGNINLVQGLTQSCNIVFYTIGRTIYDLDPHILSDYARAFGIGQPTGVVGVVESAGTLPDPEWKQRQIGQAWFPGDSVNLAIGQGYLEATPLQMANAISALATGRLRTSILATRVGETPYSTNDGEPLPVSETTTQAIVTAMKAVTASPTGTAHYAFRGYAKPVAAKTGSAENQGPEAHAWFVGYGPADAPEVVVVVMIEGGRAGGEVAAPLARKMFEGLL